ncbi:MAG: RNA-binding cell elongation regulator Jag/EloR [Bacillota bacterium]
MRSVEKRARSVEEAVEAALEELGASREECTIVVLEEPAKGLFGLIGSKEARVKVTAPEPKPEGGRRFLLDVLTVMGLEGTVDVRDSAERIYCDIEGPEVASLIGRHGQTLNALQYLANLVASRETQDRRRLIVDVSGYRRRREEKLVALVQRLAERVVRTGNGVELEPMDAHERKVVHTALQNFHGVQTHSEGDEPYRRVIISCRKQ